MSAVLSDTPLPVRFKLTVEQYHRMVALGILIGEYGAETIWMAMALITKQSTYTISFNDRSLGIQ